MTHTVLVLCGGLSPERDVSIRSGRRTAEALRDEGLDVHVSDVDASLLDTISDVEPDCIIPMLHGAAGEDGSLADVIRTLGYPFVGSRAGADRVSFDKPVAKAAMRHWKIPTPEYVALPHTMFRELGASALLEKVVARLGLPLMVKPAKGGSSLGASVVTEAGQLPAAMVNAFAYGDVAMIERFVTGLEVSVAIIETDGHPQALPAVEIVPDSGFYDYAARYTAGMTEFFVPARVSEATAEQCAELALTVHQSFALRDYSRVDLIIAQDGSPVVLEVNVAPGMTETSLLPQAVEAAGLSLGGVFARLVDTAVARGT